MGLTTRGKKFFTAPITQTSKSALIFWLSLSLTVSAIYAFLALQQAFSSDYVIQDDARQHVFWMQRFLNAELFPNDLIADYFQSVAPAGYKALYKLMATFGISPIVAHKILPMFLGVISTAYCFYLGLQLLPVPFAGFLATLLLNQSLWMQDGLISATPKAFIYPLFLPFLYYLVRQHLLGTSVALILLGLFYPQGVLIAAVLFILRLVKWEKGQSFTGKDAIPPNPLVKGGKFKQIFSRFSFKQGDGRGFKWQDYRFSGICLGVAFFILLPYALSSSDFGPTIARSQAELLPEFLTEGRSKFFIEDSWQFWFHGRSGIGLATILTPAFMAAGFLLPILQQFPGRFALSQEIKKSVMILPQLIVASFGLFFAAHALLFRLHLPSRYTQHTLRIAIALAAAIALTLIIDTLWSLAIKPGRQRLFLFPAIALLLTGLIFYPQLAMNNFPWTYYQIGQQPELYQFFQQQPTDSLIASLSEEANNLPTFAQRSILTGREYAIPYHSGYYSQFRTRTLELIKAQYSPDLGEVQGLIEKYDIDFLLVERGAFTPGYLAPNRWLNQYQVTQEAIAHLSAGNSAAISLYLDRCSVFESNGLVVLNAECLRQ